MTIPEIMAHLKAERQVIDNALRELETLARLHAITGTDPKRRGRKAMGHEERLEVSRRMKAYWSKRRKSA